MVSRYHIMDVWTTHMNMFRSVVQVLSLPFLGERELEKPEVRCFQPQRIVAYDLTPSD